MLKKSTNCDLQVFPSGGVKRIDRDSRKILSREIHRNIIPKKLLPCFPSIPQLAAFYVPIQNDLKSSVSLLLTSTQRKV